VTGPDHWTEADLILTGDPCSYGCPHSGCEHEASMIARAQVHATLSLAAITASAEGVKCGLMIGEYGPWLEIAKAQTPDQMAAAMAAREKD
jgi:hypothetical protein